jgi:branched-chain amino acid transport system substrate-binding protein
MKHSIKKLVAGTALALGALSAFAADPIKIGSVLSVTGPGRLPGDPELKTLQLYVDDLNKKGGVLGRPLQLVHYDDGSDANKANGFTKRLIEDDKVDVMVGGTTTGATMSTVPLVEKAGIPFIAGRCRGHRRAGQEVGLQDPTPTAWRPKRCSRT